ncbi:hypothetical protein VTI74DRAFT_5406 [Chaetomium olivicolor]
MMFEFIDNNRTDDAVVRRQIRSHAARGHNAGKKLNRPSRKNIQGLREPDSVSVKGERSTRLPVLAIRSLSLVPTHWRKLQKPGSEGLALIQRAVLFISGVRHAPELDAALDYREEVPSRWVQPMFLDEAYFHGAMALFIAGLNSPADQARVTAQAQHICRALQVVNARLSEPNAAAKENIAVILILGMYERYDGNYRRGLVHLDGLRRILEMRGGIAEFARVSPEMTRKVFRADLEYSLHLGIPTRFTVQDVGQHFASNSIISSLPKHASTHSTKSHSPFLLVHPVLTALLQQATHVSRLLNTASQPTAQKVSSRQAHDTFILLGYRLQALSPLLQVLNAADAVPVLPAAFPASYYGERRTEEEAICVGLTAFVVSFLRGGGCGKMKKGPLSWVCDGARLVGTTTIMADIWEWEVVLWMIFIGVAAEVFDESDVEGWVVPKAREAVGALGLGTWENVVNVLRRWPWIDALHGKRGREFWEWCRGLSIGSGSNSLTGSI